MNCFRRDSRKIFERDSFFRQFFPPIMRFESRQPHDASEKEALEGRIAQLAARAVTDDLEQRRQAIDEIYDICSHARMEATDISWTRVAVPVLMTYITDPDDKVGDSASSGLRYCEPESIEPLIDCLSSAEAKVRKRACEALGGIGDAAIPACDALRRLLTDSADAVRQRAAWALGLTHDTSGRTVDALFALAAQECVEDRRAALHALGNIGEALPDPAPLRARERSILDALEDDDEDVRWSAAYVVQSLQLEPERHVQLAARHLAAEPAARVRAAWIDHLKTLVACSAIIDQLPLMCEVVRLGGSEAGEMCRVLALLGPQARTAVPCLVDALHSGGFLALAAAEALWLIDRRVDESLLVLADLFDDYDEPVCDVICVIGPAAAPLMPKVIAALETDNWDLQWAAADALGAMASDDPQAIATLTTSLGHDSPIVRSAAARALARIGEPAIPALSAILESDGDARHAWAADALGRMGYRGAAAADFLRARLEGSNQDISAWCAIGLAKVTGDPTTVAPLAELLLNEHSDLRLGAIAGLQAVGVVAPGVLEALNSARDDEDPEVRMAAEEALLAVSANKH